MCPLAGLPTALLPSWQLAQPLTIPAWLKVAILNVVVLEWQVSHAAVVATCVDDFAITSA